MLLIEGKRRSKRRLISGKLERLEVIRTTNRQDRNESTYLDRFIPRNGDWPKMPLRRICLIPIAYWHSVLPNQVIYIAKRFCY